MLRLSMPKSRLKDLQPVALGSSGGLAVGQAVWGVGNTHGLDHTLTQVCPPEALSRVECSGVQNSVRV